MIRHSITSARRSLLNTSRHASTISPRSRRPRSLAVLPASTRQLPVRSSIFCTSFHTSRPKNAQSPTADALMEDLNELYATAKDEFEIASEETEKKTVYAEDDRQAAQEALQLLKEGYEKAVKESDPEVAKEVQSRVGQRIRELQVGIEAMEERAIED